jgi:hypothetical protein
LTLLLALGLLIAGCGDTVIDAAKTEDTVKASLESKNGLDRRLTAVHCPGGVEVTPGASFQCSLEFPGGQTGTAVLKIRTSDADLNLEDVLPHSLAKEGDEGAE